MLHVANPMRLSNARDTRNKEIMHSPLKLERKQKNRNGKLKIRG